MSDHTPRERLARRSALKGIAMGGLAVVGLGGTAAAKPGRGPPGRGRGGADVVVPDDEGSIQAGVDAADSGDTVAVHGGTYVEQVVIDKDLTLRGVDDPTIRMPETPGRFTIPETAADWEPIVLAYGGTDTGGAIQGSDTVDVSVSGITLDGNEREGAGVRTTAVLARNVSGAITDTTVVNMGIGGGETFGLLGYGDSELRIHGNEIHGYERGGIGVIGDGGAHPSPEASVRNNLVVGSGGIGEAWGSNGIQIGYGAEGDVRGNIVRDNRYAEEAFTAAGIILIESDGVHVRDNTVENSDVGIAVASWGSFRSSATNNKVMRNDVREANAGILLRAVSYQGFSTVEAAVNNNKVVNNTITDPDPNDVDTGIAVQALETHPDIAATADNNKVIRNTVTGFADQVQDSGTETKLQAIEP